VPSSLKKAASVEVLYANYATFVGVTQPHCA